jgi:hypothetical protein
LLLTAPTFIAGRAVMYDYYWTSTVSGKYQYYKPKEGTSYIIYLQKYLSLLSTYIGERAFYALAASAILAAMLLLAGLLNKSAASRDREEFSLWSFVFLAILAVVPLFILSTSAQLFNEAVVSIVLTPLILAAMLAVAISVRLSKPPVSGGRPLLRGLIKIAPPALAALLIALSMQKQITSYGTASEVHRRVNVRDVSRMYRDIGDHAVNLGLESPSLSIDRISGPLNPSALSVVYYEKTGALLRLPGALGDAIGPVELPEAERLVKGSAFVIFSENKRSGFWPFDASMEKIAPNIREILKREFRPLGDYHFDSAVYTVYVKPDKGAMIARADETPPTHPTRGTLLYRRVIVPLTRLMVGDDTPRPKIQLTFDGNKKITPQRISKPGMERYTISLWIKPADNGLSNESLPGYSDTHPPTPAIIGPLTLLQIQKDKLQIDFTLQNGQSRSFSTRLFLDEYGEYPWTHIEAGFNNNADRISILINGKTAKIFEGVEAPLEGFIKLGGGHMKRFWKGSIADARIKSGDETFFSMDSK